MAALDATIGGSSANSYSTQADANDFLTTERLYVDAWTVASSADKDAALIWATRTLDDYFDWEGSKVTEAQALRHPRYGLLTPDGYNIASTDLAPRLIRATQTLAAYFLEQNRIGDPEIIGLGISRLRVDTIDITVDKSKLQEVVPSDIILMLRELGSYSGLSGKGDRFLPVRRT